MVIKAKLYSNFLPILKGLMFKRKLKRKEYIILDLGCLSYTDSAIHTLFIFYSIDAIWLDDNFRVVDIKRNIRPFTLKVKPRKKARYVLETLPYALKTIKTAQKLTIKFK